METKQQNITDLEQEYLNLAVIEQKKFDEISQILGISREEVSTYWDKLSEQREYLSTLRKIWKSKFENTETTKTFWDFKKWYENAEKKCFYCGITEPQIKMLIEKAENKELTKRNRGEKLEIERLSPNEAYDKTDNLVFSCYWCNNAKTDTFTADEFKEIGKVIGQIWNKRLAD